MRGVRVDTDCRFIADSDTRSKKIYNGNKWTITTICVRYKRLQRNLIYLPFVDIWTRFIYSTYVLRSKFNSWRCK